MTRRDFLRTGLAAGAAVAVPGSGGLGAVAAGRRIRDYPNVLWNLSNETRAPLAWSRYWAEYLVQLFGGQGGEVKFRITPGRWQVVLYEPKTDTYLGPGGRAGQKSEVGDDPLVVSVPDYKETAILHLRRI